MLKSEALAVISGLRQKPRRHRRIRRSLDSDSAATLVHAFVSSRVDYCNAIFAGAPKMATDRLQRVLNAASCIVSGTRKYDHGLTALCTTSYIGLTFRTQWSTSWVCWCTDASTTKHLCTWWTTARQSLTSFSDSVGVRPAVTNFPCHVIGSALTAVGLFLWPYQLS